MGGREIPSGPDCECESRGNENSSNIARVAAAVDKRLSMDDGQHFDTLGHFDVTESLCVRFSSLVPHSTTSGES